MNREQRRAAKAVQASLPNPPRAIEIINQEYNDLCSKAGQLQYTIKAQEGMLMNINKRISELSLEAEQRNKFDKDTAPPPKQDESSKSEGVAL